MNKKNRKGGSSDEEKSKGLSTLEQEVSEETPQYLSRKDKFTKTKDKFADFKLSSLDFKPYNLLMFFSMLSPLMVSFTLVLISLMNRDIKGLVYLAGVLLATITGGLLSPIFGSSLDDNELNKYNHCSIIKMPFNFGLNPNFSLNSLFLGFTFMYLAFPMMTSNNYNIPIFLFLLLTLLLNNFTKWMQRCSTFIGVLLGTVAGSILGIAWFSLFTAAGYKSITYFDLGKSNNVQCGKPGDKTFKCRVIKNGQVIANI